jgi:hypothetical protein
MFPSSVCDRREERVLLQTAFSLVVLILIVLLVSPFFTRGKANRSDSSFPSTSWAEKEAVYAERLDLEYDFAMGKIPEADYAAAKERITEKAAVWAAKERVLHETAAAQIDKEIREELEKRQQVRDAKTRKSEG